jgi:hypothetical protein
VLIDYLRYVAFDGRLRHFYQEGLYNYVQPSVTTGQHLRFALDDLDERIGWRGHTVIRDLYWESHSRELNFERLKHDMGLASGPDGLTGPNFQIGGSPATFIYKEIDPPKLEIIIDIDPDHWTEQYSERRSYEGIPIIFRRAGPARASLSSGDKLLDNRRRRGGYGTLCGFFCSVDGPDFALTCGHVTSYGARILVERRQRIWKLPLWSNFANLGETRYYAMCGPAQGIGPVRTQLDAALIAVDPSMTRSADPKVVRQATIKPISTVLQEEPVRFRGAGRVIDTLARVSAVTVRKSIDLFKDGELRYVGDVLMLGHRHPMYIVQRVSRPGDSGAAVRQDFSSVGPFTELNRWHGMILGSDEGGAYATHAEHLWAWAAQQIGDGNVEFLYEA